MQVTYKDKVIKRLHDLHVGVEYLLNRESQPEQFAQVVKSFIRMDFGRSFGWYIEFRDDYQSIKKKEYIHI